MKKIPVIDITDLYHPYQDPGDNFDLLTAYALPEIDLRAVILDITERFRWEEGFPHPKYGFQGGGPREPGIIPVSQCNYLFGRSVPYGIGPFREMNSQTDIMDDVPAYHNGIEVFLNALRESEEKVQVLCFGSARVIAAAFNREPALLREKIGCIHLSAGSSGAYLEWNVELDVHAVVRLLRSDLPIALYPCATENGPWDIGRHNTFWKAPDLQFVEDMDPPLRRYLSFAFSRSNRLDHLRYLEKAPLEPDLFRNIRDHSVWETAIWMQVAGRTLQKTAEGYRYRPAGEGQAVLEETLLSCRVQAEDNGLFTWDLTDEASNLRLYTRETPENLNAMLAEALAELYVSFRSGLR